MKCHRTHEAQRAGSSSAQAAGLGIDVMECRRPLGPRFAFNSSCISPALQAGGIFACRFPGRCPGLSNHRARLRQATAGQAFGAGSARPRAFTLIELLLVMALLVIVLGVTFPSLQNFFRGRTLNSEVRRFLALTRYAQSRAVSEGIPTVLWVDAKQGTYGLQAEAGYLDTDTKAVEFQLEESVRLEVSLPLVTALMTQRNRSALQTANLPAIRFWPDGSLGETSPESVRFEETRTGPDSALWVAQAATRNGYEIRTEEPRTYGRR